MGKRWDNIKCYLWEHDWVYQGANTWTVICSRCGEKYYLAKVSN